MKNLTIIFNHNARAKRHADLWLLLMLLFILIEQQRRVLRDLRKAYDRMPSPR